MVVVPADPFSQLLPSGLPQIYLVTGFGLLAMGSVYFFIFARIHDQSETLAPGIFTASIGYLAVGILGFIYPLYLPSSDLTVLLISSGGLVLLLLGYRFATTAIDTHLQADNSRR